MDVIKLRNIIRENAKSVGLSYTEIETLADINEVLNQEMPCMMWLYEGEDNDYVNSPNSEVVLSLFFLKNLHDEHKVESGQYERDYIITQRDILINYYKQWLRKLPNDELGIKVLRDQQIPFAERMSIEGFFIFEMRVTIEMLRNFCFDE